MKKSINPVSGSAEWEAICERCGLCCYEKYDYRGRIFYTATPCPHLNTQTRLCKNYANRSQIHPDCAQLTPEIVAAGILPQDCPYVRDIPAYKAPVLPDCPPFNKK